MLVAVSVFASTVLAQPAQAKPKVAVLGLEVTGDSAMDQKATEAAKSLTRELRREAGRSGGVLDLAPNSSKDLLEMKLLNDCNDEARRCMSEIGRQLGADRLLYGKLERTRRGYNVSLRLLDTESAQVLKQLGELIPLSDATAAGGLQRHARELYRQLTGAEAEGTLAISSSAERGTVYVDGQIRTSLSAGSARVSGLSPGVHAVAIEARGFERFESEVDIEPGGTENLRADMTELPGDDIRGEESAGRPGRGWRIAFWSGAIVTAGAGAGWAYSGFTVQSEEGKVSDTTRLYEGPALPNLVDGYYPNACNSFSTPEAVMAGMMDPTHQAQINEVLSHCDRGDKQQDLVNWVWIPATATAALFTAFAGYKGYLASKSSSEREMARKRKRGSRMTVTPALGPNLVGAGLEIQF
jgi:hypothetical protein